MGGIVSSWISAGSLGTINPSRRGVLSGGVFTNPSEYGRDVVHAGTVGLVETQPGHRAAERGAGATALMAPLAGTTPSSDGNDAESRRRAAIAAERAPTSATSLLTEEADPGGLKRKRLLGE